MTTCTDGVFDWCELPILPDPVGFAAPFAGVSDEALIVAGGSNFSSKTGWSGGTKLWSDRIFLLDRPDGTWRVAGNLPQPLAYGVAVTIPEGVLCIGGSDKQVAKADVWLLRRNGDTVVSESWPALPAPLFFASGALVGRTVYIAGGVHAPAEAPVRQFLALDLDAPAATRAWQKLEPWPGDARMLPTAGSLGGSFYLFSGHNLVPSSMWHWSRCQDRDRNPARRGLATIRRRHLWMSVTARRRAMC